MGFVKGGGRAKLCVLKAPLPPIAQCLLWTIPCPFPWHPARNQRRQQLGQRLCQKVLQERSRSKIGFLESGSTELMSAKITGIPGPKSRTRDYRMSEMGESSKTSRDELKVLGQGEEVLYAWAVSFYAER
ncbi:hypothetical protein TNIN_488291 [Trichonephila inaurata madagascariensis]|uniref:Uncharacterized protein n=1 Tax=Trichonephila inaurata madagascariensis TaxID=2747483 RepID=A0A8X6XFM3_9ARAC|nr:hypothetical protein TNIN_488291 [Trichonephila inaurata madagascariensis]